MNIKLLIVLSLLVTSCSQSNDYLQHIPLQQGIPVESEKISHVKIGMSQSSIIDILGYPTTKHPFNEKVWVYLEEIKDSEGNPGSRSVIIQFDNKQLVAKIEKT